MVSFIFTLVSPVYAANDYSHPMIFSRTLSGPGKCNLITIHSYAEVQGNIYTQSGVGWFVLSDEGYHVVTPAHVIAGASLVVGECLGYLFPMGLKSKSETLDLALLTIPEAYSALAFPMIALKNREEFLGKITNSIEREMLSDLNPEHFDEPFANKMLRQKSNYYKVPSGKGENSLQEYKSYDIDLIGFAYIRNELPSLVAETLAIRPGYSGAPFFIEVPRELQRPQHYLVGMLTRAEINGSRSLGVSLPQIFEVLPSMLNATNNTIDVYTYNMKLPVRLQYNNRVKNNVLERSQELIYNSPSGKSVTYTEICDDTTAESSEWGSPISIQKFEGKSLKDLGLQKLETNPPKLDPNLLKKLKQWELKLKSVEQKSGGGDYGEGGGSSRSLQNSKLATNDSSSMTGAQLTSYKREKTCLKMAIRDEQGHSLDSMISNGKIVKTTNLMEGFNALRVKSISLAENTYSGDLCKSYELISADRMEAFYESEGKVYVYGRTEGVARSEANNKSMSNGTLRCQKNQIEINLTSKALDLNVLFENPTSAHGYVSLKNMGPMCTIQLNAKNYSVANRWKHQIRSQQMDLDINLGTSGRILTIKVLRISPECRPDKTHGLWLEEINFSDQATINMSIKPDTFTAFRLRSSNESQ